MIRTISDLEANVHNLARRRDDIWALTASGVTRAERQILALVDRDAYNPISERARVLLVGGLANSILPGNPRVPGEILMDCHQVLNGPL